MNFSIVKLRFRRPLHLSRGKMNTYESSGGLLHSDTLQAALYVTALQLYGKTVAEEFKEKVRLSSAFPFTEQHVFWLPKPLSFQPDHDEHRKELKKMRYLTLPHFQQLINGVEPAIDDLLEAGQPVIWKQDTTQRVLLDRISLRGVPFYLEKLYPFGEEQNQKTGKTETVNRHGDRGLYVIVQNEDAFPYMEQLFRLLSDTGLGLQRTLGNGVFDFEMSDNEFSLDLPAHAAGWINLSLFRPDKTDLSSSAMRLDHSHYQLLKRGGWIANPTNRGHASLRKKAVMMFVEGSVLDFPGTQGGAVLHRGVFADLKPDVKGEELHEIYRDGRGIFLPMK